MRNETDIEDGMGTNTTEFDITKIWFNLGSGNDGDQDDGNIFGTIPSWWDNTVLPWVRTNIELYLSILSITTLVIVVCLCFIGICRKH